MTTDLNTTFRHRLFYLRRSRHQHVCSLVKSPQPTNSGQQKNIRGTLSAFTQMQAGHGIGAGVVKCTEVRTSLAVVGARPRRGQGSVESMDFPDIFLFVLHVQP